MDKVNGLLYPLLLLALASCGKQPEPAISKYHPGDEYSFAGRTGDEKPHFLVLKVDTHPKEGNIIHVAINGVRITNPKAPKGFSDSIGHFPISEAALDQSGPKILKTGSPLPDFKEAYQLWRKPFDEGKAGMWTKPLAECLQALDDGSKRSQ